MLRTEQCSAHFTSSQFLYVSLGAMLPEMRASGTAGEGVRLDDDEEDDRHKSHASPNSHSRGQPADSDRDSADRHQQHEAAGSGRAASGSGRALALLDPLVQHAGLFAGFGILLLVAHSGPYIEAIFEEH